jgi:hypothetical protein
VGVFAYTWEFPSVAVAMAAFIAWDPLNEAQPSWWDRDPNLGIYRIQGQEELEYVKFDQGTIEQQVFYAIKVTCGIDRIIQSIEEDKEPLGRLIPEGTRLFRVIAQSSSCTHKIKCEWMYAVYQYLDRCVVYKIEDCQTVSLANLIQRLTRSQ